jgi:hypothetical protein
MPHGMAVAARAILKTTIAELHAAYLAGQLTARAVTQAYLDRIAAYDRRGPVGPGQCRPARVSGMGAPAGPERRPGSSTSRAADVYRQRHPVARCRGSDGLCGGESASWYATLWPSMDRRTPHPAGIRVRAGHPAPEAAVECSGAARLKHGPALTVSVRCWADASAIATLPRCSDRASRE